MRFEPLDAVTAYTTLRDALQRGGRELQVSMLFYFWGRLAAFNIGMGTISAEENASNLEAGLAQLEHPELGAILQMAEQAEAKALSVGEGERYRLMIIGYWSSVSYFFRYLSTSDWKFTDHASDSFLSGVEDYLSEDQHHAFRNELVNVGQGYEAAERRAHTPIVEAVRAIIRWTSASPIGSILPPL